MSESEELSFILRGPNRLKVLEVFAKEKAFSRQIEKQIGMYKSHVSRTLKELIEKNLIICNNPNDRNFKFYKLTKKGKTILNKAKQYKKIMSD